MQVSVSKKGMNLFSVVDMIVLQEALWGTKGSRKEQNFMPPKHTQFFSG